MFIRKKLPFIIVSITLVALALCGWTAYAATAPNNSAISTSVNGTFKSVSTDAVTITTNTGDQTVPLAKSVWVYRNDQKAQLTDLKTGDQIELILNSKQQAAYVKASTTVVQEAVPSPSPTASASAAPVTATPEPTQTPAPVAQVTASAPPAPASQQDKAIIPGLEDIDLNVDGKHFKLHINQSKGAAGTTYDLNIKPDGAGMIHLKGEEAAEWIQKLLASVDLKSGDAEQKIAGLLATHYNLDASKLNVHMKTKWAQQQVQMQQQVQKQQKEDNDGDDDHQADQNERKDVNKNDNKDAHKDDHKDDNQNKQRGKEDHKSNQKARSNGQHDD
ncbi:hypothetical protein [Paenibacillus aceris]|uniref:Cu/Ag efflux protein CusF n=1 Tax=Paenibacillus aceris TaxID=869555 RepID=A0ABS4I9E7_9BACL|nr:hypothetical protein [Paenibacillus aceris]MBP1967310.1 Cu/Ag efflux protein CusF [Paenibacillus aceris]NHW38038.1 hypothetical protein [Paenibacillus aceris]